MATREDYITAIGQLVQGEIPLDEADKILAINIALKAHSKRRPRVIVEDEDGDGGFDYAITGLEHWSDGFSVVKTVEYPVDDDDETPEVLQDDAWMIYAKPSGEVLRFKEISPTADEDFRVVYTALHTCTTSACTVKAYDTEPVQALAAAYFCDMLATYYAQSGDSSIGADSVDHKSKAKEYAARAKAYRTIYFDHLGIAEGKTPAASISRDQDKKASWQSDKVTHKSKYR